MDYRTLNELFYGAMETHRRADALRHRTPGGWTALGADELVARVRDLALGFHDLGVERGDRVALLSENRLEWFLIDKALLTLGAVGVPIYSTLTPPQIAFIVNDAEAKALVVSRPEQQAKIASIRSELRSVEHVVRLDPPGDGVALDAVDLEEVRRRGAALAEGEPDLHRRLAAQSEPGDLATIIYTSGTTGEPKGVMLTHANLVSNVKASLEVLPVTARDEALSALPYSHVFERMVAHYLYPAAGVGIAIAESIDRVPQNLVEIRPTVMTFVPRFYEKMYARIHEALAEASALRRSLFDWAVRVGREHGRYRLAGTRAPFGLALRYRLAHALVFRKIHARVGGRLRFFISGGAPLSKEIAEFFWAVGLTILEGYGLTETSPVIAVNRPGRIKFGTVGPPIPGVEVRIADDGEILVRGPNVMKGYWRNEAATREAIDEDGWFHTGDIGRLDEDGFLVITDRKKDLIVTAGGKKIAPQPIENRLKTNPYIQEIVLVGNKRRFASALVVPDFERLGAWAAAHGIPTDDRKALLADPRVVELIEKEIDAMTQDLAQFEKIKKVTLLDREFTMEGGELTPTLKVKRNVIEDRYKALIDEMYAE